MKETTVQSRTGSTRSPGIHSGPAALVVAHPGHELRVFGWLELTRPLVFVLTDGSGHSGVSRLESTTKIMGRAGARRGSIYGRFSDVEIYRALLQHDFGLFIRLAEELAESLVGEKIASVAGDASEGYNPGHEVNRLIVDAAIEIAVRRHGHAITNFSFTLVGPPCQNSQPACELASRLLMHEEAFARKMKAIHSYMELASEVEAQFGEVSRDSFRVECLHRVGRDSLYGKGSEEKPYYEQYGELQVANGFYKDVIRYREHVKPLADALRQRAGRGR